MSAPFGTPWKDDKLSLGREGRRWKEAHIMDLFVYRDLTLGDNLEIYFGNANDVSMVWDGTDFLVRPVTDDTGTFKIGDGTTDMDFKWFGGATTKYVLFDVGNSLLTLEDVDLHLGDSDVLQFGDSNDITMQWNGSTFAIAAAADSQALLGGSQYQIDLKHYGDIEGYNNEADATGYAITAYKSRGAADTALSDNDVVLQLTGVGFNDNATPAQKTLGNFKLLMTDVTDTTEDGAFVFEIMVAGAAAAEKFRIADVLTASAAVNVGVDGTGYDVQFFGDTSGCKFMWDQSEDQAVITRTTSTATATTLRSFDVSQTHTGASAVNSAEVGRFVLTSAVQLGSYANALMGKVDLSTAGYVSGLIGVVCAELDMPGGAIPGGSGTYSVFEAEINCPTSYAGGGVPINVIQVNAWGAQVAQFDTDGALFALTGVSSGSGNMWYDHQAAAPSVEEWVRVRTPSGVRYLALYDAVA